MLVDHGYMLHQLQFYLAHAREMKDPFMVYLLGMVIEHCDAVLHPKPTIDPMALWSYEPDTKSGH
jgi:hypothetical protein